jgi:uncharacterized protein YjiS (DUF1127 family)
LLDLPLTRWASDLPELGRLAPSRAIRRIVVALRLWRRRARSQQQLRQLSDHVLNDIGLTREEVGYEFPGPFRRLD